jgi:aryl-alcohol dehydrogenase-like predicted oxidoreductase
MEHRPLGRTGVSVSKLCLGAMMFGAWGNADHAESIRIIHAALDAGINFVDTADVYGQGESEEIVGKALGGGRRDDVVLATKVFSPMGDDVNRRGMSRRWIMRAVEDSLRRLDTDWIDTALTRRSTSSRRSARSATSCSRARSATSARRPLRRRRSWRRSGRRETDACSAS